MNEINQKIKKTLPGPDNEITDIMNYIMGKSTIGEMLIESFTKEIDGEQTTIGLSVYLMEHDDTFREMVKDRFIENKTIGEDMDTYKTFLSLPDRERKRIVLNTRLWQIDEEKKEIIIELGNYDEI